ncbi:unnamed protein product [Cylicocyclus nassatus]|uniref:C2H2-type domain-containing protein n=1 Tax=Cylicocyclus nassatus TaxID=53992 RepID=A0AA36H5P8_CYLNA|nr:unnamed protein product [Cylicocyclus nassatus]
MPRNWSVCLADRVKLEGVELQEIFVKQEDTPGYGRESKPSTSSADIPGTLSRSAPVAAKNAARVSRLLLKKEYPLDQKIFYCHNEDCNYVGPNATALHKHCKRMNHIREVPSYEECPVCRVNLRDIKALILHAIEHHQFNGEVRELDFDNSEAFEIWKEDVERKTSTRYSSRYTKRRNRIEYSNYRCDRSGTPRTKSRGLRKPHTKIVNKSCTAFLKVKKSLLNNSIHVEYCTSHLGHALQPRKAKNIPTTTAAINNEQIGGLASVDMHRNPQEAVSLMACKKLEIELKEKIDLVMIVARRLSDSGTQEASVRLARMLEKVNEALDSDNSEESRLKHVAFGCKKAQEATFLAEIK